MHRGDERRPVRLRPADARRPRTGAASLGGPGKLRPAAENVHPVQNHRQRSLLTPLGQQRLKRHGRAIDTAGLVQQTECHERIEQDLGAPPVAADPLRHACCRARFGGEEGE